MPKYKAPRGTYDVVPENAHHWRFVEDTFAELATSYGYGEIRTPVFEETDLFVRSSGDTSEVVTKQMYTFEDKGGRSMTLKPEATAPAIRACLEHSLIGQQSQVARVWYKTPIFRYERPQKGRCRQAHQVGMELVGSTAPAADAEVIEMTVRFYQALGIKDLKVLLNSIGRDATRAAYRDAIMSHVQGWLKDQDDEFRVKAEKNPLRLLDTKDPDLLAVLSDAPIITDYLEDASKSHIDEVLRLLGAAGIEFEYEPRIVRGLDYYTDTVFEVQGMNLGAQSALCGGGRYDGLVEALGGPATPAVGAAMGIERALIALEEEGALPEAAGIDMFIVAAGDGASEQAAALARELRDAGLSCSLDIDGRSRKAQMKLASRSGATWTAIICDEEVSANEVTLLNVETGEQNRVARAEVLARLKS
jgi:histidyl-tRNA synthetase